MKRLLIGLGALVLAWLGCRQVLLALAQAAAPALLLGVGLLLSAFAALLWPIPGWSWWAEPGVWLRRVHRAVAISGLLAMAVATLWRLSA